VYNLNTIGVKEMINRNEDVVAGAKGNENVFPNSVAIFRSESGYHPDL
jgi:hypothetical protein